MRLSIRRFAFIFANLSFALACCSPTLAQDADEDPFGEAAAEEPAMEADAAEPAMDAEPAEDFADDAPKPRPARRPASKPDGQAAEEPAVPESPAVQAILESKPKTPAELLRAIHILADLGQPRLAQPFVEQLVQSKLDQTSKAALTGRFNSATLMRLAREPELSATLGPFVDDLLKSSEAYRRDPKRLAAWVAQLSDPEESLRVQAAQALLRAREAAVAPLVAVLADPARSAQWPVVKHVLVRLDDLAVAPLLGVLEAPDAALKTQVIDVLGQIRAPQAVPPLLGPLLSPTSTPELRGATSEALRRIAGHVPSSAEALRLLEIAARRPLEQSRQDDPSMSQPTEVWHWNAAQKQSMPVMYDATGAGLARSVRLARDLYSLDTNNASARRLYFTALLQAAKLRNGLDKPLPNKPGTAAAIAAAQGPAVIEDVLASAMAAGYIPAAVAAAEVLGQIGNPEILARAGSSPSTLALAAQHADRRLRFAAVGAILKLSPTERFAGSSHVTDALAYFASSYGAPRVLVVHPRSDMAQSLAGLAIGLGYEADIATDGRRGFDMAVRSPDYEFILIHSALDRPRADELLAQLRRDRRTALIPVGLISPLEDLDRVTRFAENSSRALAFLQPQKDTEMKLFAGQVLALAGRDRVAHAERKAQALAALDWMATLSESPQNVFDLRRLESTLAQLLHWPDLGPRAALVLGRAGSGNEQRSLLQVANLATQPMANRKAAVEAFAHSVQQHGLALTRDEIMDQYDLYNHNAGQDADSHAILASILDVIENKRPDRQP